MCLNIGTSKNINLSFETNGKLMALGVSILKHFRVISKVNLSIFKNIYFPWFLYLNAELLTLSSVKTKLEVVLPSKLKCGEIPIGK